MSSIKLSPNASGTGEFTIAAPNSNTNRTLTLPDQTGTILTNAGPYTASSSATAGAVTIDASNNVGVGTSSPNERMTITSSTAGSYLQICDSSTGTTSGDGLFLGSFNGAAELKTKENKELQFGTNNTERARIDSSGNLLVNTTSGYTGKLRVNNASGDGIGIQLTGSGGGGLIVNVANTNQNLAFWVYSGSGVGSISTNGTSTSYNTSSDYRLKHDIAPMTGALAKVAALKPVTYKWNADDSEGEGFIAHELAEVCPQAVTGEKDAVDADGNPQYQGIDVSFLVATLTAAIQELNAKVEAQAAEIAALKGAQ